MKNKIEKVVEITLILLILLSVIVCIFSGIWMIWNCTDIILKTFVTALISFNLSMCGVYLWVNNKEKLLKKE